jgi:hypothetical protein
MLDLVKPLRPGGNFRSALRDAWFEGYFTHGSYISDNGENANPLDANEQREAARWRRPESRSCRPTRRVSGCGDV